MTYKEAVTYLKSQGICASVDHDGSGLHGALGYERITSFGIMRYAVRNTDNGSRVYFHNDLQSAASHMVSSMQQSLSEI